MQDIKIKISAKTDTGLVRNNNEDNFQVSSDLSVAPMKWVNDKECTLGNKGALLVVADGMGGMNAGEVASEIAIETIKEWFAPEKISDEVLGSKLSINSFMKKAIIEADKRIKQEAKEKENHKGMGTTIVIAWLLQDKLYLAWCGDSRAYIYNKAYGLRQISKDHSYVQTLVDKQKITQEEAFDFPDSNIITRSLSDSDQKARPDVLSEPISVCNGDIVLLCTDGLNGMIRDHEIEHVLSENEENTSLCADNLIQAACDAAGDDNITVALCKIVSGCSNPTKIQNTIFNPIKSGNSVGKTLKNIAILCIGILLGFPLGLFYKQCRKDISKHKKENTIGTSTENISDENDITKNETDTITHSPIQAEKEPIKGDTIYIVKDGDFISSIEKTIGRDRKNFDIVLKGKVLFENERETTSAQIKINDTLTFRRKSLKTKN